MNSEEARKKKREYMRAYRARNPEARRECDRQYREKNQERVQAVTRRWKQENPDKVREGNRKYQREYVVKVRVWKRAWAARNRKKAAESTRRWAEQNPERRRASKRLSECRRRRMKRAQRQGAQIGPIPPDYVEQLMGFQGGRCAYCHEPLPAGFHVDHIIPLARGGAHSWENLVLACPTCNLRKGSRYPEELGWV